MEAVDIEKSSLERAEKKLADMQWYVVKKYKSDPSAGGNDDASSADDAGVTRYERDTRTVEWAEELLRECKAVRAEAMECIGSENVLLDIHCQELQDQLWDDDVRRKLDHATEKLEAYRKLERAVESARESHRRAEAAVANFRWDYDVIDEYVANAREYCYQADEQYTLISERLRAEMVLLMQKQRDIC